ncbi:type I methionyl aminopeptidase [Solicola gregarius]|uniref:Methionine aminopeptidase n=1 Tax=Solicola gregarius TaxID=2908642 RepID=A0AA46YMJ8_9ACTN|nr:type I methionyl aminopeptidase [Solicola gregarius]UYM05818.1 type I methionyl aminopeptidase [Solicola gregarius]
MIQLKSARQIAEMRPAGRFVGETLAELRGMVDVGVNLMDLEHHTRRLIRERGAASCYWDYAPSFGEGPFRNVICLSVNDAVLHGLPTSYRLKDGDLLTMDLAVSVDGWVGDAAISVIAGTPRDEDVRIIRATEEGLAAGIEASRVGNRIGDVSAAVADVAAAYGYPVNDQFGGHGVGHTMHERPSVPNTGRAGRGLRIRAGLVFTIEPWFAATTNEIVYDPDGWTIRSGDGSRTAHSEHTLAITEDGPEVLTRHAD